MMKSQQQTTAFVTAPIIFLAIAAIGVVLGSLIVGAHETNSLALQRQRETLEHALEQHGRAIARELKAQTVWNDGYRRALAADTTWLHSFFGEYLSDLFGYDGIYVLSPDGVPVYGFAHDEDVTPESFKAIEPRIKDLIAAVRHPDTASPKYDVATTPVALNSGPVIQHHSVADTRAIDGVPATVVVSTIVPDHSTDKRPHAPYPLLVAVENIDASFLKQLGENFEFENLRWIKNRPDSRQSTETVSGVDGSKVGTLAWREAKPGWQFMRSVSGGFALALALIAALTALLLRWGRHQAREIVKSEADARKAARTDTLTGLPNRVAIKEALSPMIGAAQKRGMTLGFLCIDIDRFKDINNDFGNRVGDELLVAVSQRLRAAAGSEAVLCRLSGDDFVALVPDYGAAATAELATDIVTAMAEPFQLNDGTRIVISGSVGHATAPGDGETGDDLVRRAELALGTAKVGGGGRAVAFAREMDDELYHRRAVESALRAAVAAGNIDVVYQPQMSPDGMRVVGVEALARWTDARLGPITPDVFIPIAEETGLISRIGEIVLHRALADARAWPGITVAVNVSGAQIHHGDIVSVVADALREAAFPPRNLEIEVTESVLLADERRADEQIKGLQRLGVKVALDDFGSGYSSLLYLRKFGFDKLKIDRSFIQEIGTSKGGSVILGSIIRLGIDLKMTITAEGIETPEQHGWLAESGCHLLQGYLFSHPLSAAEISAFIAAHQQAAAS
jgi:diguanylate cyclase (GGDEF)-like protein